MLARVKGWVEYSRVKTNPYISQKHKIPPLQLNRLAVHSLPPGAICQISHWKHSRSQPLGGSLAPAWRHTRKRGPVAIFWYTAWRLMTYRQADVLRSTSWAIFKSVSGWPISPISSNPNPYSRLASHSHSLLSLLPNP
ncbi:hypothetical protein DEO72_LG10g1116 [Vigna unguiculata]|uniref:Uncharacterized protein n=1 Tax=Vigna unguiculata TaxID=3917 RepID=A0A4D6N7R6_VIGUN|nr:hypothetical protein DEO72_LG10g1116 [Vigna unguiculata]